MKMINVQAAFTRESKHVSDTHWYIVSNTKIQFKHWLTSQHKAKLPNAAKKNFAHVIMT